MKPHIDFIMEVYKKKVNLVERKKKCNRNSSNNT